MFKIDPAQAPSMSPFSMTAISIGTYRRDPIPPLPCPRIEFLGPILLPQKQHMAASSVPDNSTQSSAESVVDECVPESTKRFKIVKYKGGRTFMMVNVNYAIDISIIQYARVISITDGVLTIQYPYRGEKDLLVTDTFTSEIGHDVSVEEIMSAVVEYLQ